MLSYLSIALGFAVNQCGLTSWSNYLNYSAIMLVNWALGDGSVGWDKRFCTPYGVSTAPFSTDQLANPSPWSTWLDIWNFHKDTGFLAATGNLPGTELVWGYGGTGNLGSSFRAWAPNTEYYCNSWVVDVRAGCPLAPNSSDSASLRIAGPFTGSPVNVSHTVSSSDIAALINIAIAEMTGAGGVANPITADLISQINASSTLAMAGITANTANTVPGAGGQSVRAFQTAQWVGRLYISFNSANTATAYITVTGSFTTNSGCSLYVQPNGDGVNAGMASFASRPLNYQCAKTGISGSAGSAPTGTALQTIVTSGDGMEWCFCPEKKTPAWATPGGSSATFPDVGFGGLYVNNGWTGYVQFMWSSTAYLQTAGVANASDARTNLTDVVNQLFSEQPSLASQFNLCVAP